MEDNAGGRLENNPGGKWRVQVESWSTVQRARSTLRCRKAGVHFSEGGMLEYGAGDRLEYGAGRLESLHCKVEGAGGRLEYCKVQIEAGVLEYNAGAWIVLYRTMQVEKAEVLYRQKAGIQFKWKAGVLYIARGRLEYGAGGRLQNSAGRLKYFQVQVEG